LGLGSGLGFGSGWGSLEVRLTTCEHLPAYEGVVRELLRCREPPVLVSLVRVRVRVRVRVPSLSVWSG